MTLYWCIVHFFALIVGACEIAGVLLMLHCLFGTIGECVLESLEDNPNEESPDPDAACTCGCANPGAIEGTLPWGGESAAAPSLGVNWTEPPGRIAACFPSRPQNAHALRVDLRCARHRDRRAGRLATA